LAYNAKKLKNINMKQLLSLFLFLLPCLAWAQYPSNGNQKITLGEQTSAYGLIFRGVASIDTVTATSKITRANKEDTSAFILLDTVTNLLWHYKTASNGWIQAGGGTAVTTFSGGTTGLTPSTATSGAVTLGGTLAVANGGTGSATKNFVDLTTTQTVAGLKTFNANVITQKSLGALGSAYYGFSDNANNFKGYFRYPGSLTNRMALSNNANDGIFFVVSNYNDAKIMLRIDSTYKVMIGGDISPDEVLDVQGNAKIRLVGTASSNNSALYVTDGGVLSTNSSDVNKKHNIRNLPYGLNTINQLNPVAFDWNENDITDIGFIAQDIESIIPESVITNWDSQLIFRQEKIVPILVKAIQEQNLLIKALEQRIINLENK